MLHINIKSLPRHPEVPMDDGSTIPTGGWLGLLALKGGFHDVRLLPELPDVWSRSEFRSWLRAVNKLIQKVEKAGYYLLPNKLSTSERKSNYAWFVNKSSYLGRFIGKLSEKQRSALYANAAAICQYGFQPFDRYVKDVEVRVFDEGSVTSRLKDFDKELKKKLSKEEVASFYAEHKESVQAPYGDGQIYLAPDSPYWELLPELVRGMKRKDATAMKIIGSAVSNPFIFLKGVIVRLSKKEWATKCASAGIHVDYKGILVNSHAIKNKLKLRLGGKISFNVGYHNDNRQFEDKSQIVGYQVYRRSGNMVDRMRYTNAVQDYMSSIYTAVKECDVRHLVTSLSGISKVVDGTPYYGSVLKLLGGGLPVSYLENIEDVSRNMIVKGAGRPKVKLSTRTLPKCSNALGILQIALTRRQARRLKVRVGDTVVVIRSPKAAGFPALTMKVVKTTAVCCSLNPILYTLFNQGDFDGDTIAVYKNEGLVEMHHSLVDVLNVLFEHNEESESMFSKLFSEAFEETETIENGELTQFHPVIGSWYQMLRAKAATGPYDNFATRLQSAGFSDSYLRAFWNTVVQACITNMKHVGGALASPMALGKVLAEEFDGLPKLTNFHYFLSGNMEGYLNATERSNHTIAEKILRQFESLDFQSMVQSNKAYSLDFHESAMSRFEAALDWGLANEPELIQIFAVNQGKVSWVFNRKTGGRSFIRLNPRFSAILNPPMGTCYHKVKNPNGITKSERFKLLKSEVDDLVEGDEKKISIVWKFVYMVALTEYYKRWLLTNTVDDEVSASVSAIVSAIGKDVGFDSKDIESDVDPE